MKRKISFLIAISLVLTFNVSVLAKETLKEQYKKDELIVIYKKGISKSTIKKDIIQNDGEVEDIITIDDTNVYIVEVDEKIEQSIETFEEDPKVLLVQPNYKYTIKEKFEFKDPRYQYQFDALNIKGAWDILNNMNHSKTKIGIIDTGIDIDHEDLRANIINYEYYIKTIDGEKIKSKFDSADHGTHVSGIIGATYGNNIGVAGIASGYNNDLSEVMMIGASSDGETLYTSDIIDAISYAKESEVKVINMSFGGYGRDRVMEEAIKDAYDSGIVLVAASGNEESNDYTSPSDFREVISVNASNEVNEATYFSNYGEYKDITAPGSFILSTAPGDSYQRMTGTSMSSPMIAGIVALMLDANPSLTPSQVYNILCGTASNSVFNTMSAYGIANAKEAVKAAKDASNEISATSITLKTNEVSLNVDDNYSLEYIIKPVTSLKPVTWTSLNQDIATVDQTGRVTGIKSGKATIKAQVDGKTAYCEVTVKDIIPQTGISISNKEQYSKLKKGDEVELIANIYPKNATNQEVYFHTSNKKVATLYETDDGAILLIKGEGDAIVTVTTYDKKYSDSINLHIGKSAKYVSFINKKEYMLEDEKYTFKAIPLNNEGTSDVIESDQDIFYRSTNETVATINKNTGEVTALKEGITYIKATVTSTKEESNPIEKTYKLIVGKNKYDADDYGLSLKSKTYNTVNLKWNKIDVASSYIIKRKTKNTSYKVIATIKDKNITTFKDKSLYTNVTYYYKIEAIYESNTSLGISGYLAITPRLNTPTLKLSKYNNKSIKISWSKISGAEGYLVYRSTSKNGTYKKIANVKSLYYINKGLTKNKNYYYKVKAYKHNPNGKVAYSYASNAYKGILR